MLLQSLDLCMYVYTFYQTENIEAKHWRVQWEHLGPWPSLRHKVACLAPPKGLYKYEK